ncbi:MAG: SAM-dependent methyltransferase [Lachnospiraceae bacterium]|nr:SAM-dependent methyltransferase [Lachnospiraceae bacterium]
MGREVNLSARMLALTGLLTPGYVTCDVGCDHGFVSIYLVQKQIAPKVFAMDVRSGPLSRAQEHIREYGLEDKIETRLSDGLHELRPGEAQAMICAGMGGKLMMKILEEGMDRVLAMKELILQPQSDLKLFRSFLREKELIIVQEDMIYEDGKFYPMMRVVPGPFYSEDERTASSGEEQELWDEFGPFLLRERHPVLLKYLNFSEDVQSRLYEELKGHTSQSASARIVEVQGSLQRVQAAKEYYA